MNIEPTFAQLIVP